MDVLDAAHRIGHEYPGGVVALSPRMGISKGVLNSKLDPRKDSHHLTLKEAERMQLLTGRCDILIAMADTLDHVCIPKPCVDDGDVGQAIARMCAEFGDYMRTIDKTWSDKRISQNDRKELQKELIEMVAAASHILAVLEQKGAK